MEGDTPSVALRRYWNTNSVKSKRLLSNSSVVIAPRSNGIQSKRWIKNLERFSAGGLNHYRTNNNHCQTSWSRCTQHVIAMKAVNCNTEPCLSNEQRYRNHEPISQSQIRKERKSTLQMELVEDKLHRIMWSPAVVVQRSKWWINNNDIWQDCGANQAALSGNVQAIRAKSNCQRPHLTMLLFRYFSTDENWMVIS